ncbi:agamous-like MADS-box protein AGL80 [Pyrus communis]|uniref:agamous-like MADS-box protein AGL80 n=1 Tax=Pyrus communis TaxID=23211 RepID=UPI0035C096A4
MTRTKVKLTYISNDSARKATFKKRRKGLMKKVSELSTLCDVQACAIIYSPYDSQPELWPSPLGVQRVLAQFKTMPEMEQSKKMVNQESFLRQRIAKANEQLKKQRKENREKEMTRVMFQSLMGKSQLHGLSMVDLNDLGWLIDQNLKEIDNRMKNLNEQDSKSQVQLQPTALPVPAATVPERGVERQQGFELNNNVGMAVQRQQQPFFMDMMNVPQDHQQQQMAGIGGGYEMNMLPFAADQSQINAIWSNNSFYP